MKQVTEKVRVKSQSLTQLQENGWDVIDQTVDESSFLAAFTKAGIMEQLTYKQQCVVALLAEGLKRQQIAKRLKISLQETHQIIARIRRRLQGGNKEHMENIKTLVYHYQYFTNCSAETLHKSWNSEVVLSDYPRPSLAILKKWIKGFRAE